MRATVFGAGGFVGSHLVAHLESLGWDVQRPPRGDQAWTDQDLGHVFYCIGLTADFRSRPFEAIDAHVGLTTEVLRRGRFDSFLYLSSTRVYGRSPAAEEGASLLVDPADPSDLYNLSKRLGEAACFAVGRPEVRVARLSNVFGAGMAQANFLASVLRDAVRTGAVALGQDLGSDKDYVAIETVVQALVRVSVAGPDRLYNVAAGHNTTHAQILDALRLLTGCRVSVKPGSSIVRFPKVATKRLRSLGISPGRSVIDALPELIQELS